jgi:hypothetical protein
MASSFTAPLRGGLRGHLRAVRPPAGAAHGDAGAAQLRAALAAARLVFAGEVHEQPDVLAWQCALLAAASDAARADGGPLHVVLEHVPLPAQRVLDGMWAAGGTSHAPVDAAARAAAVPAAAGGEAGFDMAHYGALLAFVRDECAPSRAFAGFPTRAAARLFMPGGDAAAAAAAAAAWGIPPPPAATAASPGHYSFFAWLLAGGDGDPPLAPPPGPRRIFPAQAVKDAVMAGAVARALRALPGGRGRVVALCGTGHVDFGFGVPERVPAALAPAPPPAVVVTTVRPRAAPEEEAAAAAPRRFPAADDGTTEDREPADFVYFFEPAEEEEEGEEVGGEAPAAAHGGAA